MSFNTKLGFLIFMIIVCMFFSCSSYKPSLVQEKQNDSGESYIGYEQLKQLYEQKQLLNQKSVEIVGCLTQRFESNQPFLASDIHNLFHNLSHQFVIDSIHQLIYTYGKSDSLRLLGLKRLMEAADFYHVVFQSNQNIRRIINRGDPAYRIPPGTLTRSQEFLWSHKNRRLAKRCHLKLFSDDHSKFNFLFQERGDYWAETSYDFAGLCSEGFGRIVASIHPRPQPEQNVRHLLPHLKKWDIICQKSPGRLTDRFIPGYFGHAGIYLGDSVFVETKQSGVVFDDPYHFAEGRDFVILRPEVLTEEQSAHMETVLRAQLGKKYDFNFNTESPDRLICTELIFLVYDQINWKTRKVAGRNTISPDDLVKTSLENNQLEIPIYLSNNLLVKNPDPDLIERLLE